MSSNRVNRSGKAAMSQSINPTARAFTLVELLVVIGIIALLISILLPVLGKAREQAKRAVCASNLKQCAMAMLTYAGDNKGQLPNAYRNYGGTNYTFFSLLVGLNYLTAPNETDTSVLAPAPEVMPSGQSVLQCPSATLGTHGFPSFLNTYANAEKDQAWRFSDATGYYGKPDPLTIDCSYGINACQADWTGNANAAAFIAKSSGGGDQARNISKYKNVGTLAMFFDGNGFKAGANSGCISGRHLGQCNIAYFDSHVDTAIPIDIADAANTWYLSRSTRPSAPYFRWVDSGN